jgi:ParB family chromosome partitioning protein
LIKEVSDFLNVYEDSDDSASCLSGSKSDRSDRKVGEKYDVSPRTIARYVRIAELIKPLQNRVDKGELGIYSAVSLSYLTIGEQESIEKILAEKSFKVSMVKAGKLRELSNKEELSDERIMEILSDTSRQTKPKTTTTIRINNNIYSKYFSADMKQAEIQDILDKALGKYFNKTDT